MKYTSAADLSKKFKISKSKGLEAIMKADLISAVLKIAERSGLPRSAITGILSGSLQKVTLDRILKLIAAVGLTVETKIKKAA